MKTKNLKWITRLVKDAISVRNNWNSIFWEKWLVFFRHFTEKWHSKW